MNTNNKKNGQKRVFAYANWLAILVLFFFQIKISFAVSTNIVCTKTNVKTGEIFVCSAKCNNLDTSAVWTASSGWICNPNSGISTNCSFDKSGFVYATAAGCDTSSQSITVEAAKAAQVSCAWPYYFNESFTCETKCDESLINANWEVVPSIGGTCNPLSSSATSCTLTNDATVRVTSAGICTPGSTPITLNYRDMRLICNPSEVRAGSSTDPGASFTCNVAGGDGNYTWLYSNILKEVAGSTGTTKVLRVEINNFRDIPLDGKVNITVQDSSSHTQRVDVSVIPYSATIDEVYTIGNSGIAKGMHQDLYLRVSAQGGVEQISSIEVKLVKGFYSATNLPPQNVQIFNVLDTTSGVKTIENNPVVSSGAITAYDMLYKIPVFIPEYAELTDGNYTLITTVFDKYLQNTKSYLNITVGNLTNGDINNDHSLDILDIVKVVAYYLNPNILPTNAEIRSVDFNQNNKIDLVDVIKVIQLAMAD